MARDRTKQPSKHQLLKAAYRTRLAAFARFAFREVSAESDLIEAWHVEVMMDALQGVWTGRTRRLVISAPPRSAKSFCASIAFPLFALGNDHRLKVMVLAGTRELASELRERARKVLSSQRMRALFPHLRPEVVDGKPLSGGGCLAFALYGHSLGRGADFIIVDDPLASDQALSEIRRRETHAFFDAEIVPRLSGTARGGFIGVMKRVHPDDLVAHVRRRGHDCTFMSLPAVAQEDETWTLSDGTVHLRPCRQALQPKIQNLASLKALLYEMNASHFSAQYQQAPYLPSNSHEARQCFQPTLVPPNWTPGMPMSHSRFVIRYDIDLLAHKLFDPPEQPKDEEWREMTDDQWELAATDQQARLLAASRDIEQREHP
jgi:hypothetical protein